MSRGIKCPMAWFPGQPSDGPMGISVALTPSTTTNTPLSKTFITNASFRTKKLPGRTAFHCLISRNTKTLDSLVGLAVTCLLCSRQFFFTKETHNFKTCLIFLTLKNFFTYVNFYDLAALFFQNTYLLSHHGSLYTVDPGGRLAFYLVSALFILHPHHVWCWHHHVCRPPLQWVTEASSNIARYVAKIDNCFASQSTINLSSIKILLCFIFCNAYSSIYMCQNVYILLCPCILASRPATQCLNISSCFPTLCF